MLPILFPIVNSQKTFKKECLFLTEVTYTTPKCLSAMIAAMITAMIAAMNPTTTMIADRATVSEAALNSGLDSVDITTF